MRSIQSRRQFVGTALTAGLAGCAGRAEDEGLTTQDVAAIQAVRDQFVREAIRRRWDLVAQLFTEDGTRLVPTGAVIEGRARIAEAAAPFSALRFDSTVPLRVSGNDRLAYAWETYVETYTHDAAPQPVTERGKWLLVMEKQASGAWLIVLDIWNAEPGTGPA